MLKCYNDRGTYVKAVIDALALVPVCIHVQNVLVILKDVKPVETITTSSTQFKLIEHLGQGYVSRKDTYPTAE
jgi:hypothetical protein